MTTPASEARVALGTAKMNKITVSASLEYCALLWDHSGRVIIVGSFGTWSHRWTHIGDRTLADFLATADRDYVGGKMVEGRYREDCPDATAQIIREQTLELRRIGSLTRQQARDEWTLAHSVMIGETSLEAFMEETEHTDSWDMIGKAPNRAWCNFWEQLWEPHMVPALKAWAAGEEIDQPSPRAAVATFATA